MPREPQQLRDLRVALGRRLAVYRQAADRSQGWLAGHVHYDRSTISHLEAGGHGVPERFWRLADELLGADGCLLAGYRQLEAAREAQQCERHQQALAHHRERATALRTAVSPDDQAHAGTATLNSHDPASWDTVVSASTGDRGWEVGHVLRKEFMRLVAALGVVGAGTGASDHVREAVSIAVGRSPVPAQVGRVEVEQVHHAALAFATWRDRFGGGACQDLLARQMQWAAGLLRARTNGPVHRELHAAVGAFADKAGWAAFDAGRHDTAMSYYRLALHCADEAADWSLRAEVLTDIAYQAAYRRRLDEALSLIELAQVRADRVAGTGRAAMASAHARVLGAAGEVGRCRDAISTAEEYFAHRQPVDESCVSVYFQRASELELADENGHALFYPGLHDPVCAAMASDRLRLVIDHPAASPMHCATVTGKLATLQLLHGDRDEGLALAHRAIDVTKGMSSARLTDDLRLLRTATIRHAGAPVSTLQKRLDSTLISA